MSLNVEPLAPLVPTFFRLGEKDPLPTKADSKTETNYQAKPLTLYRYRIVIVSAKPIFSFLRLSSALTMKNLRYTLLILFALAVLSFNACKKGDASEADFSTNTQTLIEGEKIDFKDLSSNEPNKWAWTFEGGTPFTSSKQNPQGILYTTSGTYTVSLTVVNQGRRSTETKTSYILVEKDPSVLIVDFSTSKRIISAGESIGFTDLTINNPSSWEWSFEGGTPSTSTDRNPQGIQYDANGTYDVTLKATNDSSNWSLTKTEFITVDASAIRKLEVVSNVLAIHSSGTKNPSCGGWAWNVWNDVISTKTDAIAFTIHSSNITSENYINPESDTLDSYLGTNLWPTFLAAGNDSRLTKLDITGANTEAAITQILKNSIDDATTRDPLASAGLTWEVNNDTLSVTSYVGFLKPASGNYYVAVWVSEDDVYGPQTGHSDGNAYHQRVLRTATDNHAVFGVPVASGDIDANTFRITDHTAGFDPSWNESNINVAVIIWKKVGDTYSVVNVSSEIYTP